MLLDLVGRIDRRVLMWRGFESRLVTTAMGKLHVLDGRGRGDLPPILIFHGINSRATNYRRVLPTLLDHSRRVIVPDLPGHGRSDAPDKLTPETMRIGMRELLDEVVTEPVIVFGNSLGGVSAIRFAQERPELCKALILCSPGGAHAADEDLQAFLDTFRFRDHRDALAFVDLIHLHPPWYRRLIARGVYGMFADPLIRDFLDSLSVEDLITPGDLAQLTMPTLLLWGRGDRLMPMEHYRFYRDNLPVHAVIEDPIDFGHSPYQDRPELLSDRILAYAREHR